MRDVRRPHVSAHVRARLRDSSVLFYLDNEPDVHTLNRQATRTPVLAGLMREIFTVAVDLNISIRARHIPSDTNKLADFLSRTELRQPADIVASWHAEPENSAFFPLLSVSVVHSQQLGSSQARPPSLWSTASG